MKTKVFSILFALVLVVSLSIVTAVPVAAEGEVTIYYGDIELPSGGGFFLQPQMWDLNACNVTVSYTLDLSGAPNVAYTSNYGQSGYVGLVYPGSTWAGAWMSGFLCDWDNVGTEFPTYPDKDGTQDMDDKFNMQRSPFSAPWDETLYDVYCETNTIADPPFGSGSNYGIWFDRDGVDKYQANMWGMVDGGTYNTGGIYEVQITYRKASSTKGTACPLFFSSLVNDGAPSEYGIPTGFNRIPKTDPSYPGYYDFPAGISFDTDETKMAVMQVFVSGDPGNGTIVVQDLTVTGCLGTVIIDGCDTGVVDQVLDDGSTISGSIAECAADARNHGEFVSCVSHLTNELVKDGYLTGKEKGKIVSCAARADIPAP
jgi:hypothetical protein